jgi:hypothetical protein
MITASIIRAMVNPRAKKLVEKWEQAGQGRT